MIDRLHDERGETLIESLVSVGIVGVAIVALVGAVTFAGSGSTLLKAEGESIASGRSLAKAVGAYRVPSTTPWLVNGKCNPSLVDSSTGTLGKVITSAYGTTDAAGQKPIASSLTGPPVVSYSVLVAYPDNGTTQYREEACDGTIAVSATDGEAVVAMKVAMQVTAKGHVTSTNDAGTAVRTDAEVPATVTAFVYRGLS